MSFLAPLFFLAAAAIAAPILFHLIRRQTKEHVEFSSLMFLEPSPPRITRRSRIDHWLLLLLRVLALALVAFAFARPFVPSLGELTTVQPTRLTVIMLDTSASMQREDLWQQAVGKVNDELAKTQPTDLVKVLTFDSSTRLLDNADGKIDPKLLEELQPSNRAADLGGALIRAVDLIEETARTENIPNAQRSIVLVTDFQRGSITDALQGFRWPVATPVRIESIDVTQPTNVSLAVSTTNRINAELDDDDSSGTEIRVLVSNAEASNRAQFDLRWIAADGKPLDDKSPELQGITIAPGDTRAISLSDPPPEAIAIELVGDDHPFDDRRYLIVPEPIEQTIWYLGDAVEDRRESLAYYLSILPLDRPGRTVQFESFEFNTFDPTVLADPNRLPLIVFSKFPDASKIELLQAYIEAGGKLVVVLDSTVAVDQVTKAGLRVLSGDGSITVSKADVKDYSLLSNVELSHPIFRSLADARYSDFSKIQFWKHAKVETEDEGWSIPASFDDGNPAILERTLGDGKLIVFAAGWQPSDSQLALSTKFVPMISEIVGTRSRDIAWTSIEIGESSSLVPSESAKIIGPSGSSLPYNSQGDIEQIGVAGIYEFVDGETNRRFAANLAARESEMGQLDRSLLEQLGVELTSERMEIAKQVVDRQLKDSELESRQRWWRWLILAALGLIGIETWISRR